MPQIPMSRDGSDGDLTPSDTTSLNYDYYYVGTGGDLAIEYKSGNQQVMKNVADGSYVLEYVDKILSTDTTATNIVGKYYKQQ